MPFAYDPEVGRRAGLPSLAPPEQPAEESWPMWGLRKAAGLIGGETPDEQAMAMVHPLAVPGVAASVVGKGAAKGAHWLGGQMDDILRGLKTAAAPAIEVVEERAGPAINASGESAASLESLGRRAWEKGTGRKLVRIEPGGREVPFLGEPGDVRLNPGHRVGYRHPSGEFEELSRGR